MMNLTNMMNNIELFGNPTSIKNFVIEQGFGGDEEAAKEYVPDIFSL